MRTFVHVAWILILVVWLGVPNRNVLRAQETPPAAPAPPLEEPTTTPWGLSDEQLTELGESIEQAVSSRDARALRSFIDFETLFRHSTGGMNITPDLLIGVRRGFDHATGSFLQSVLKSLDAGGAYRFLRFTRTDNGAILLFRMSGPNRLNYHKLIVAPNSLGDLKVTDFYNMAAGESLSDTLARMLEGAMVQAGKAYALKDPGGGISPAIARLNQLVNEHKGGEALSAYEAMPEAARRHLPVQLLRLRAAMMVGTDELARAVEEYRRMHEDEPSADLFLADGYIARKEFDKALEAVERLDQGLGKDPFLDTYRSTIAIGRQDLDRAQAMAQQAAAAEPDNFVVQHQMLSVALSRRDHAETLRLMRLVRAEFGMEFGDLTKIPNFSEFIKSDEYRQWRSGGTGSGPESNTPSSTTRPAFKF